MRLAIGLKPQSILSRLLLFADRFRPLEFTTLSPSLHTASSLHNRLLGLFGDILGVDGNEGD